MSTYHTVYSDKILFSDYIDSFRECYNEFKEKVIDNMIQNINLKKNYKFESIGRFAKAEDH